MCDPITLIGGALSLIGGGASKPPKPVIPAAPVEDAKKETGAEILLGDERTSTETKKKTTTAPKTSGSGLKTSGSGRTGINIL